MASLTNQHGHGGACPHSDMTGTPPDACPASKCPAQTTSSSTAAKTTAASSCPYKGGACPHSDMTGTPPDACPASKCPAQMQKVGGGVGPAFTRGEIEPPAGEKDMGSSKAAVYTKEQQDRLNVDELGQSKKAAADSVAPPMDEKMMFSCDSKIVPSQCSDPANIIGPMFVLFGTGGKDTPSCCVSCFEKASGGLPRNSSQEGVNCTSGNKGTLYRINTARSAVNVAFAGCASYITPDAFTKYGVKMGMDAEEVAVMLKAADLNEDGKISLPEFAAFVLKSGVPHGAADSDGVYYEVPELGSFPECRCDKCGGNCRSMIYCSTKGTNCSTCYEKYDTADLVQDVDNCEASDLELDPLHPLYSFNEVMLNNFCAIAAYITTEAFEAFFISLGAPPEAIQELLSVADEDGDGHVDMAEFQKFWMKIHTN